MSFIKNIIIVLSIILLLFGCSSTSPTRTATVSFTLRTVDVESVVGATISLVNANGNSDHIYTKVADGHTVSIPDVVYGFYTIEIALNNYETHRYYNFHIAESTVQKDIVFSPERGLNVGDLGPAGGIIFYVKSAVSEGWRYLEAAPHSSEFSSEWGGFNIIVDGLSTAVGAGKRNTELIVETVVNSAALRCKGLDTGGFNDWFLPSTEELNLMYTNLRAKGLGDFGQGPSSIPELNWFYWSSSQPVQSPEAGAIVRDFRNNEQTSHLKYKSFRVRAIRSF